MKDKKTIINWLNTIKDPGILTRVLKNYGSVNNEWRASKLPNVKDKEYESLNVKDKEYESLSEALRYAFVWYYTPEGYEFWDSVYKKFYEEESSKTIYKFEEEEILEVFKENPEAKKALQKLFPDLIKDSYMDQLIGSKKGFSSEEKIKKSIRNLLGSMSYSLYQKLNPDLPNMEERLAKIIVEGINKL